MFILGKLLSQAGLYITFVNTDHNSSSIVNLIEETSFQTQFPRIQFLSIPEELPTEHPRIGPSLL
ncbi:hypothetical protein LguiB_035337 [Lonicera macranthoides]